MYYIAKKDFTAQPADYYQDETPVLKGEELFFTYGNIYSCEFSLSNGEEISILRDDIPELIQPR